MNSFFMATGCLLRASLVFVLFAGCRDESTADDPRSTWNDKVAERVAERLGLSRGLHPVAFDPEREAVRAGATRARTSQDCAGCHAAVYRNWSASRHRVAFTNPIYKESHERENSVWCLNCHAPLLRPGGDPETVADRVQAADGISCMVCHAREGRVLTGRPLQIPHDKEPAHDYEVLPGFASAALCADCHQFNFLTLGTSNPGRTEGWQYSSLPMQNTVAEWRESDFAKTGDCIGCHLFPGTADSHRFPGGHALDDLAESLAIGGAYVSRNQIRLTVFTLGIGHRFPTGDLFRTLRVRLLTEDGRPVRELYLRREWELPPDRGDPSLPARRLISDTTIPPPAPGTYIGARSFSFALPDRPRRLRFELYMDYLEPQNHLFTRLPLTETRPLIKTGTIELEGFDASAGGPVG